MINFRIESDGTSAGTKIFTYCDDGRKINAEMELSEINRNGNISVCVVLKINDEVINE